MSPPPAQGRKKKEPWLKRVEVLAGMASGTPASGGVEPGHCRRVVSLDKKLNFTLYFLTQVHINGYRGSKCWGG